MQSKTSYTQYLYELSPQTEVTVHTLDISIPLPSISFATSPDAIISVICLIKSLLRTAILRKFCPYFGALVLGTGGMLLSSSDLYHGVLKMQINRKHVFQQIYFLRKLIEGHITQT
jgi:hypothetical protein